jgi:hypothetical protein
MSASRIILTIGALLIGVAVPIKEIGPTHLFDPLWPAHALTHEAWQLATNSLLAGFILWLTWVKNDLRTAALISLFITGGFLFAALLQPTYGGSMQHTDGSELKIMGLSVGITVYAILTALYLILCWGKLHPPQKQ